MKRLSQTLKVGVALLLALFSNSIMPSGIAYALEGDSTPPTTQEVAPTPSESPTPTEPVAVDAPLPLVDAPIAPPELPVDGAPAPTEPAPAEALPASLPLPTDDATQFIAPNGLDQLRQDHQPPRTPVSITATAGRCVTGESSSSITFDVSGATKGARLVVTGPNDTTLFEATISTNKDGDVTYPTLPMTISKLGVGTYTVSVQQKDDKTTTKTVTIEKCPAIVIYDVDQPSFHDVCGNDQDFVYIPSQKGVTYSMTTGDGTDVVSEGRYNVSGEVTVNAEANEGYIFKRGVDNGPWVHDFSDTSCITISKTGVTPTDTNGDGEIGAGDIVTWYITVTNPGSEREDGLQNIAVTDDAATSLTNDGKIDFLPAGGSETLTATTVLTDSDAEACEATNAASVIGYRDRRNDERERMSIQRDWNDTEEGYRATTSASVSFDCAEEGEVLGTETIVTPVPQILATSTELPSVLPATGGESNAPLLMGIVLSTLTYFVVLRRHTA